MIQHRPCRHRVLCPDECGTCARIARDERHVHLRGELPAGVIALECKPGTKSPKEQAARTRCYYRGQRLSGKPCGSDLVRCNLDGATASTMKPCTEAERCCQTCVHFMRRPPGVIPTFTHQFAGLVADTHVTNCSLLPFRDRLLLAYRVGWERSSIYMCDVRPDWSVGPSRRLTLRHPHARDGQEDPRLFTRNGNLYMAFIGVRHPATVARQLFAQLNDHLEPIRVWEPEFAWPMGDAKQWEKNWQPFERDGELFAVYSMEPWRVVRLYDGRAVPEMQAGNVSWKYGHTRGGAPPVRVGDEYYAFFHGTDKSQYHDGQPAIYSVGCVVFDANTFQPKRYTPSPILWPVFEDVPRGPHGGHSWYAATAFVCGAYLDGDTWVLSYGHNDHWCRVSGFARADVEARLCPV